MSRRFLTFLTVLGVAGFAFLAGYWPEHQRYLRARADLRDADKKLVEARSRLRICHLQTILLQVLEQTVRKQHKEAGELLVQFFVEVRADVSLPDMAKFKTQLEAILEQSDLVRVAIEKDDPAARDLVRELMRDLAKIVEPPKPSEPPVILRPPLPPPTE